MLHIDHGGARIAYDVTGQGPIVAMLHCTASSARQWRPVRDQLDSAFATLAIDLHGHGESDPWPGRRPFRLADDAAAVAAVLDRVGGPVHLVGHSYGGAVALHLALEGRPLASLTLIEPVAFHLLANDRAGSSRLLTEIWDVADAVRAGVLTGDHAAGMACFVDYWSGPGAWAALPGDRQRALAELAPVVALHFAAAQSDPGSFDDCRRLAVPTLLVSGDRTTAPAGGIASRLAEAIPGCLQKVVAGAGHMLPRTHPDPFLRVLAAHLASTAGAEKARLRPAA